MTDKWLKAALIRAVKTIAQTAVATIGTSYTLGEVNWTMVVSASLLAGLLSILTSVAGIPEAEYDFDEEAFDAEDVWEVTDEEVEAEDEEV